MLYSCTHMATVGVKGLTDNHVVADCCYIVYFYTTVTSICHFIYQSVNQNIFTQRSICRKRIRATKSVHPKLTAPEDARSFGDKRRSCCEHLCFGIQLTFVIRRQNVNRLVLLYWFWDYLERPTFTQFIRENWSVRTCWQTAAVVTG